jgi:hypothetical protein
MRTRVPREWAALQYRSARDYLINILPLRAALANSNTGERVASLRTNKLKPMRELWESCIFAHGVGSCVLGTDVYIAPVENQDYDCVAQYIVEDTQYYLPIQMKELVPERLNPRSSLQEEIEKLNKYRDSEDLVVAFRLNRQFDFELDKLSLPTLNIAQLWLFGSISQDTTEYMLWGNLLKDPVLYRYYCPGPNKTTEPTR